MKITVNTSWNTDGQIIHETLDNEMRRISREVISTKEQQTRKALIAMGWTPPEGQ